MPVVLGLLGAGPLDAQETSSLAQIQARHESAVRNYDAAVTAAEAQRLLLDEELVRVNLARERRDDDALTQAHRRFQAESKELRRLEDTTRDAESALRQARQALLDGLDQARLALEAQLVATTDQRTTLLIYDRLQGVTSQYQELESESLVPPAAATALFSSGSIVFDDRDGRDELLAKAEILERRAQDADSLIAELDRRIERLQSRQRLERNRNDFLGGVERFGDTQLPAIATRPESVREEGVPADSTEIEGSLPLETQIEELRDLQDWLREQRVFDLGLAAEFRERLMQIIE